MVLKGYKEMKNLITLESKPGEGSIFIVMLSALKDKEYKWEINMKFLLTTVFPLILFFLPTVFEVVWIHRRVRQKSSLPIGIIYLLTLGLMLVLTIAASWAYTIGSQYGAAPKGDTFGIAIVFGGTFMGAILATLIAVFGLFDYYNKNGK